MIRLFPLLFLALGLAACAQVIVPNPSPPGRPLKMRSVEPKSAVGWLRRANDETNLRMPGSAPFEMKVTFHAYPGVDFSRKGHSTIITGDGTYEEWWKSPHEWRREVTFGNYHAVEAEGDGVRKLQASSDYEPSRVLMLLNALFDPIPRSYLPPEIDRSRSGWYIQHMKIGGIPWVRIGVSPPVSSGVPPSLSFSFLPNGILFRSDKQGLITAWHNDAGFSGRVVPREIAVQAAGRILLTADVSIEALGDESPARFELAGPAAAPGATLRPLHYDEIKMGHLRRVPSGFFGRAVIREVIDRKGDVRELEVLWAASREDAMGALSSARNEQYSPPTIDGSPCEYASDESFQPIGAP